VKTIAIIAAVFAVSASAAQAHSFKVKVTSDTCFHVQLEDPGEWSCGAGRDMHKAGERIRSVETDAKNAGMCYAITHIDDNGQTQRMTWAAHVECDKVK
jgi:predicted small secreted protein